MRLPDPVARWTRVCGLWLLAACGTPEGAVFTVRAPEGPGAAARIEIVLASADPSTMTSVDGQRVQPGKLAAEPVRYFRQRASGGVFFDVAAVDGFVVRIEPNITQVPEREFVPFVIAYDADAQVIGVAALAGLDGEPAAVTIPSGQTLGYPLDMVPLVPTTGITQIGARESLAVTCDVSEGPRWSSGLAWRPGSTQLRLLRPEEAAKGDATARSLDLDCDGHVAPDEDCDDLRASFHVNREETCDGFDSNCDGQRLTVETCDAGLCGTNDGVRLCDESGGLSSDCEPSPSCFCVSASAACKSCTLAFTPAATAPSPCAPAFDELVLPGCSASTPCTVEVFPQKGDWKALISNSEAGPYETRVTGVDRELVYLQVKLTTGGSTYPASPGDSVGSVFVVRTQGSSSTTIGLDLKLAETSTPTCPKRDNSGRNLMTCVVP